VKRDWLALLQRHCRSIVCKRLVSHVQKSRPEPARLTSALASFFVRRKGRFFAPAYVSECDARSVGQARSGATRSHAAAPYRGHSIGCQPDNVKVEHCWNLCRPVNVVGHLGWVTIAGRILWTGKSSAFHGQHVRPSSGTRTYASVRSAKRWS
jgi:hypothetical protein